jgi:hypothetical protein
MNLFLQLAYGKLLNWSNSRYDPITSSSFQQFRNFEFQKEAGNGHLEDNPWAEYREGEPNSRGNCPNLVQNKGCFIHVSVQSHSPLEP